MGYYLDFMESLTHIPARAHNVAINAKTAVTIKFGPFIPV